MSEVYFRLRRRRQSKRAREIEKLSSTRPPSVAPIITPMLAWEAVGEEEGLATALFVAPSVAEEVDVFDSIDACAVVEEGSGRAEYGAASASFVESLAPRRSSVGQPFC